MAPGSVRGRLPVIPVRDTVLFPGSMVPLFIGRPKSLKALETAGRKGRRVLVLAQKSLQDEAPGEEELYRLGTVASIVQTVRLPDGTTKVLLEGLRRARIEAFTFLEDMIEARILPIDEPEGEAARHPLGRALLDQFEKLVSASAKIPDEIPATLAEIEGLSILTDLISSHIELKVEEKQSLLETIDIPSRAETLLKILVRETEILQLENEIHDRVRQEMDRTHREYYLKEQMRVIQTELESQDGLNETAELAARVKEAKMPPEVEEKALRELGRLSKMPPISAEATVSRNYIEWLAELPWSRSSRDRLDIVRARKVLDEDHHGLEEVKERILEFLAVRKLAAGNSRTQVLCFVGPPGVGKTSLGRSIARAMKREFVQMSLGGIRDEAEIRGHRRTYVGALPGRILQKIRHAGTNNPVMLMDEIDKVGTDFRGILRPRYSKCLTPNRTTLSPTTSSRCLSTSGRRFS